MKITKRRTTEEFRREWRSGEGLRLLPGWYVLLSQVSAQNYMARDLGHPPVVEGYSFSEIALDAVS